MRKAALLLASVLLALGGAGLAFAQPPDGKGPGTNNGNGHGKPQCDADADDHTPDHPACQDEGEDPDPPDDPDCEADPDHPDCPDPEPTDCPPADGAVSENVQTIADELRAGGAPDELAGGIETLNCAAIVAIEDALLGDDGNGEDPDPGDPGDPGDCPPAEGELSGVVQQVADELRAGGAPDELAGGIETLNCEVIVALEDALFGDDGGEDPDPGDGDCPPAEGTLSGELQSLIDEGRDQGLPDELAGAFETLNCEGTTALEDALGI